MTLALGALASLLHLALMLAAAPLLAGWRRIVAARLAGRPAPALLQPWHDLVRLTRKQPVLAENASWLFRAAPGAAFALVLAAAAMVPSFTLGMATAPMADLLTLGALLATARCVLALAAMDAGDAFGGMAAARAMTLTALAAPALLLAALTLGLLAGGTGLDVIAGALRDGAGLPVSLALALACLLAVALAAGAPGGAAETQPGASGLEAEYSARHLALLRAGGLLSRLVWLSLLAALFLPFGLARADAPLFWLPGLAAWAAKILLLATALALAETWLAGLRLARVAGLLGVALLLGLLAALLLLAGQGLA